MKKFLRLCAAAALAAALLGGNSARAQATTLVRPRITNILSGVLFTAKENLATNATLPSQPVAGFAPTLVPYSGSHPIGLSLTVGTTNLIPGTSNVVVTVYPAYDIGGGNSTGIGQAYGTNFLTNTPLLTWTVNYGSNGVAAWTNIAPSVWEPATSLGYVVSNGCNSNATLTLLQVQAP